METAFVNRSGELAVLRKVLSEESDVAPLIIIRSPPGFGKSRLTDEIAQGDEESTLRFCIVDPDVRGAAGTAHLHEGFFLQRTAAALSAAAESGRGRWRIFAAFLKSRRWRTVREKKILDAVREIPSIANGYKLAFDYLARLAGFGNYSTNHLIRGNDDIAVRLCEDYVSETLTNHQITAVIREAQHIDLRSLRSFLRLNEGRGGPAIILEYTSENGTFASDHAKIISKTGAQRNFHILDLRKLDAEHLETLIRENVSSAFSMDTDAYLRWPGNIGSVLEMRFSIGIYREIANEADIALALEDVEGAVARRFLSLDNLQQLLVVVVLANVEAIDGLAALEVVRIVRPTTTHTQFENALEILLRAQELLRTNAGLIGVSSETVASTLRDTAQLKPMMALAEDALRTWYAKVVQDGDYRSTGLGAALRQLFRLSALTRDVTALRMAAEVLSKELTTAQDQGIYLRAVRDALGSGSLEAASDRADLATWAATVAYATCDWSNCAELLTQINSDDVYSLAMQAFALQEVGGHDKALAISAMITRKAITSEQAHTADLIQAIVMGCQGHVDEARYRLQRILDAPEMTGHSLLGYAHRFFEVICDYAEAREHLHVSSRIFAATGLTKSLAYSGLACAVLEARFGNIDEAIRMIDDASAILVDDIHDRHMILNNRSAVELLKDAPDFAKCRSDLSAALRYSRDDYSDITILNNLAIAQYGVGDCDRALEALRQASTILHDHGFADVDVYWPVCFNAAAILDKIGRIDEAEEMRRFPAAHARPLSTNAGYWAYRFEGGAAPKELAFLCNKPHHPLYLSHWLIDLEGLDCLRK